MLQRNLKLIQSVLVSLILITFLTSCSSVKKLEIFKEEVPRAKLNLESPKPLVLERIEWHVMTSETSEELFAKLEKDGIDPVLFGITDIDYEMLAKNFAIIRNQLYLTNKILDQYKDYYESEEIKETE